MRVIGVDIGGTNIRAALISRGKIIKNVSVETQANKGQAKVLQNIIYAISQVNQNAEFIGVGSAGLLDDKKGIILHASNLQLSNVPLKAIISRKFHLPVSLDNDANCFTLGEALYGAGKGYKNVIGLTLGTGVGGGIVISKKLYRGRGNAGEFGHATIKFDSGKSGCGNNGCLEEYAGKKAIIKLAKRHNLQIKSPFELYQLAARNKKAKQVFQQLGFFLGISVTNLINIFDPDIVVIGGQIANSWQYFAPMLKQTVKQRCRIKNTKICKAQLSNAALLGAAALYAEH
ncbi:MAG: ROK family protein [Candidatus Woesearchaeota archaeon]